MLINNQKAFTLVESLIALAVLAGAALGAARFLHSDFAARRQLAFTDDRDLAKLAIFSQIDCYHTFLAANIDPLSPLSYCLSNSKTSGQTGPYLRLARLGLNGGPSGWLTGPLEADGSARLGRWNIRASCSNSEQTLVVRIAPADQTSRNFYGKDSVLFGDPNKTFTPLCYGIAPIVSPSPLPSPAPTMAPPPGSTCSLAANPPAFLPGQSTNLQLSVGGMEATAEIDGTSVPVSVGPDGIAISNPLVDSVNRSPKVTTTYRAEAGGLGGFKSCSVTCHAPHLVSIGGGSTSWYYSQWTGGGYYSPGGSLVPSQVQVGVATQSFAVWGAVGGVPSEPIYTTSSYYNGSNTCWSYGPNYISVGQGGSPLFCAPLSPGYELINQTTVTAQWNFNVTITCPSGFVETGWTATFTGTTTLYCAQVYQKMFVCH